MDTTVPSLSFAARAAAAPHEVLARVIGSAAWVIGPGGWGASSARFAS